MGPLCSGVLAEGTHCQLPLAEGSPLPITENLRLPFAVFLLIHLVYIKFSRRQTMTVWSHKVRAYYGNHHYSGDEYPGEMYDSSGFVKTPVRRKDTMSIEEWLDWQCEDGWELFKFHPNGWCVFRREN